MKIFTCRICGEVYIGKETPHTCPFCGVNKKYLWLAKAWKNEVKNLVLSEVSKKNIKEALKIELSNTAFYFSANRNLSDQETALMFKGLAKVEREHASVFRKMLRRSKDDDPVVVENCPDDKIAAIGESKKREQRAVEFYGKALSEATEPWIKEVFTAIMETEKDHLELDNNKLKK